MRNAPLCIAALWLSSNFTIVQAEPPKLPDAPGKEVTEKVCGSCHGAELLIGRQETRESWAATVDDMMQRGATGTNEELSQVVDYLSKNFSKSSGALDVNAKVNVNKATAKDLQTLLQLSDKQAEAIVHQRQGERRLQVNRGSQKSAWHRYREN